MIKTSLNQKGSAHIVIIIILVIALLGVLGFVFWQNFVKGDTNKDASKITDTQKSENQPNTETLVYHSDSIGIEFKYPKDWIKIECDSTYVENPQNRVYFGTTNEGLAIVDGKSTQLCGGGSDFPPQMVFAVGNARSADEEKLYTEQAESATEVMIDGKAAKKIVNIAGPDSIMPGLETTMYSVDMGNGRILGASYQRYPGATEGSRDNSEASRQKFMDVVEKSLRFL